MTTELRQRKGTLTIFCLCPYILKCSLKHPIPACTRTSNSEVTFKICFLQIFCLSFPMDLLLLMTSHSSQWKVTDAACIELQVIRYAEPMWLHKSNFWDKVLDSLQNALRLVYKRTRAPTHSRMKLIKIGKWRLLISHTTIAYQASVNFALKKWKLPDAAYIKVESLKEPLHYSAVTVFQMGCKYDLMLAMMMRPR